MSIPPLFNYLKVKNLKPNYSDLEFYYKFLKGIPFGATIKNYPFTGFPSEDENAFPIKIYNKDTSNCFFQIRQEDKGKV